MGRIKVVRIRLRFVVLIAVSLLPWLSSSTPASAGPPVTFLLAGNSVGAVPHARIEDMPVPWGDLYFLDSEHLLVPYAEIRAPTPEELAQERARRQEWLKRPTEEIVDELVQKTPGEPENVYKFRRWLAERFVEYVKANPDMALKADQKYVHETGLRVFRPCSGGIEEIQRIPVWRGRASVQNTMTSLGGPGPQAISWTTPMANLQVGVVAGSRYVAAWSWPGLSSRPEDRGTPLAAVLLDRASLRVLAPLEDMRPVIWVGPERLLVLHHFEGKWHPALLDVLTTPEGVAFQIARRYTGLTFAKPAPLTMDAPVLLPPPAGDQPRFLLFRHRLKAAWLDLEDDRFETLDEGTITPYGRFELLGSRVWMVLLSNAWWAVGIRDSGERVIVDQRHKLPFESGRMWEGPVAAVRDGLLWGPDPGIQRELGRNARSGSSSNQLALYWFHPQTQTLRRLPLPTIPARPPVGNGHLVAVSPDNRWLAVRVSEEEVRIWSIVDLFAEERR